MRDSLKFYHVYLALVFLFLLNLPSNSIYAQKVEKNRLRIAVDYVKIMNAEIYFNIKVGARVNKKTVKVSNIELTLSNEFGDEALELGKVTTNMDGESRFTLNGLEAIRPDSSNTYTVVVSFEGNDMYKRASKSISFKDAIIKAKIVAKDSVNYISASLQDSDTQSPIADENLKIQVQRLFRPLVLGDPFNKTDEEGSILVPIEDNIPGVGGNLVLEVVLQDHDEFGTVKSIVHAPIGVQFEYESTFDQRTMWSPRNKTPLFLLILPNIITFGMWGFIAYLILNLFKIVKS
jgi:hypothetical protein